MKEVVIGGLATLIVFAMLYKFAWPAIAKGMQDRTARIQGDLDTSAAARTQAEADAAEIRTSLGDVDGERTRLFAEADAQAAALLEDGRLRLGQGDRRARGQGRGRHRSRRRTGCRRPACRHRPVRQPGRSSPACRRPLDDATQQELIESFIARVGASVMSDAQIQGYARALFEIARADGTLDEVEDELFRFARSYESSEELRNTLSDEQIPAEKRQAIVEDLLGGKATPTTTQLVSMVVGSGRARDLPAIVDVLVHRASERQAARRRRSAHRRAAHRAISKPDSRRRWRTRPARASTSRRSSTPPWSAASSPPSATTSSTTPSAPVSTN